MKIMVISAIGRESSSCYILARRIAELCDDHDSVEVDWVTPTDVGLPLNDGNVDWSLPVVTTWQERMAGIHGHIWVSPEYHSAMTGAFKNLFDYLPKEPMHDDAVGLVALAGGSMAALNTLNGMAIVARSLGAWVAPQMCAVESAEAKAGLEEGTDERLGSMVSSVLRMTRKLHE